MKVQRRSYGNKLLNSFVGVLIGLIMIIGSFVVLYINEGRENLGKTAEGVIEIDQNTTGVADGTLVCIKGKIEALNYAADDYLANGNYLVINRNVEMYAYVENEHSDTTDNFGGSSTTVTTYTYDLKWTNDPKLTSTYQGDSNEKPSNIPSNYDTWIQQMPNGANSKASALKMGKYNIDDSVELSGQNKLALSNTNTDLTDLNGAIVSGDYIYKANQNDISASTPELGDIRISYSILMQDDEGMLIGALKGTEITKFTTTEDNTIFRFFADADTKEEVLEILKTEHKTMTWILRIVGWLLMFFGLLLMSNPITQFLSLIPALSHISGFLFGVAAFFISLIITALTVFLSIILHNFWYAMIFIGVLVLIIILVLSKKRKKVSRKRA